MEQGSEKAMPAWCSFSLTNLSMVRLGEDHKERLGVLRIEREPVDRGKKLCENQSAPNTPGFKQESIQGICRGRYPVLRVHVGGSR